MQKNFNSQVREKKRGDKSGTSGTLTSAGNKTSVGHSQVREKKQVWGTHKWGGGEGGGGMAGAVVAPAVRWVRSAGLHHIAGGHVERRRQERVSLWNPTTFRRSTFFLSIFFFLLFF